ncbi:hypothetical protein [Synechococcus sp. CBW1107]|nr:hypothetical protein [Synechococcus sp. CBW1107]
MLSPSLEALPFGAITPLLDVTSGQGLHPHAPDECLEPHRQALSDGCWQA